VKTSGADGLHVFAPITRRSSYEDTHAFAEAVARRLAAEHEGLATTEWLKRKREGVLVDFHQNGMGRTMSSAYSVRPRPGAPVSTPLLWDELDERVSPRDFTMEVVLDRVERHGDLWEPVLRGGQSLARAFARLRAQEEESR
jgi:bifunctional non-homologous end joining protein LigD